MRVSKPLHPGLLREPVSNSRLPLCRAESVAWRALTKEADEFSQILSGGGEQELVLRAGQPAQAQTAKVEVSLQMRETHLNLFTQTCGAFESSEGAHAIDLPALARTALRPLVAQLMELRLQIKTIEKELLAWHRTSQESRRLETIPGVGFITATAIAATVTDPSHFRSSREFSAWLGLTPRQNSSGGKDRLGRVSKMGNGYLRSLIVVGATAMIRYAREKGAVSARWINALLEKKPARLVSVAVANKTARIAWALLVRKEDYRAPMPVAA